MAANLAPMESVLSVCICVHLWLNILLCLALSRHSIASAAFGGQEAPKRVQFAPMGLDPGISPGNP